MTDEDIDAAGTGIASDEFDQMVLSAVDELHSGSRMSPQTVGGYGTLALALNTFDVAREEGAGTDEFYAPNPSEISEMVQLPAGGRPYR